MLLIRKSVKWIAAIILMMQLIPFSRLAASSILLQSVPTELVETAPSVETSKLEFEKTLNFDRETSNIKTFSPFQYSALLVLSNKVYYLKLKTQNFQFFNTIKPSLLAKLLPLNPIIIFVKFS